MSKCVNKTILLGHVGQNPETKTLTTGTLLTTLSLATSERVKKGEEWKDRTDWHTVLCYGRLAEIVRDYVRKGSKLLVDGKIRVDTWDDKATGQKRSRVYIVAYDVILLDAPDRRASNPPDDFARQAGRSQIGAPAWPDRESQAPATGIDLEDSDIPF